MSTQKGNQLEVYIQEAYSKLLNLRDEGIKVERSVNIKGISGVAHQIDVYYEFAKAKTTHRVGIECKNKKRPVELQDIRDFAFKLQDIGNMNGIIIVANGLQKGAYELAIKYGIEVLSVKDIPSIPSLWIEKLKAVMTPTPSCIGEPFWVIMQKNKKNVTNVFYGAINDKNQRIIPLYFSKQHAKQTVCNENIDTNDWVVRGMPRHVLRAFIVQLELFEKCGDTAGLCFFHPGNSEELSCVAITREQLIKEYYYEDVPSIKSVIENW